MHGLTECVRTCYLPYEQIDKRPDSVGIPIPGCRLTIVDEQGNELSNGQTGELVVSGVNVMNGYWQDPELGAGQRIPFDLIPISPYNGVMREWSLGPGDPVSPVLAADFRLTQPDYINDQIWELDSTSGDPPALALRTTYGLRARSMRLLPSFSEEGRTVVDPAQFPPPPVAHRIHPNLL